MAGGYMGRICFVDLTTGQILEDALDGQIARDFIGGYGLGARILFERQKAGVDPLGPDNILGFVTGPLTGTKVPSGGRYMVVCKSPLTGGWGDANSGGYFGSALKSAGWDAVFVSGMASSPKILLVTEEKVELRDGEHLWGVDAIETEAKLREELGLPRARVASIGQASERLSLISGIVNDGGRIAARSGVGAVMGSKKLKAAVVHGKMRVPVSDKEALDRLHGEFIDFLRGAEGFPKAVRDFGTCSLTVPLIQAGATPLKNWSKAGGEAFPTANRLSAENVISYQTRKYGCANCPIACGGLVKVTEGAHPLSEMHKPEYETLASFGAMCLNDDLHSIMKLNDMCNRSGLDTISAGTVMAFAMECYEKGVITDSDTDGIELKWGDGEAMIAMLDKIIKRESLGDILADGVKVAAQKLGKGSHEYAMHVGGQEPGMHSPLFLPSRSTGYVCDPTPGRHTATPMSRLDAGSAEIAPYPELQFHNIERYEYKSKGAASATASCYWQVGTCAGVCLFPVIFFGTYPLLEFLNAVTGWDMDLNEALKTGARVQTLRQCFNLREGVAPSGIKLPGRMAGLPPATDGPFACITLDTDSLEKEFRKAMGFDPETGRPTQVTMDRLGLTEVVAGKVAQVRFDEDPVNVGRQ